MKRGIKQIVSCILAAVMVASLVGCSSSVSDDPASYPLEPQLTTSEVLDYNKNAYAFDTVVTRNLDVDSTNYELRDVTDSTKIAQLSSVIRRTEELLSNMTYEFNAEDARILDEETYHYIKSFLNDKALYEGVTESIQQALGYYFIDVTYKIASRTPGTFKPASSLLGLNGAIVYNYFYGTDSIDENYMAVAISKLNEYYDTNNIISRHASYDPFSNLVSMSWDPSLTVLNYSNGSSYYEGGYYEEGVEGEYNTYAPVNPDIQIRSPKIDVNEFNSVVGSSISQTAYMPKLDMVYEVPQAERTLSGVGIYPAGLGGLAKFGFDRTKMTGQLTMRYVYKDDMDRPGDIIGVNVYPKFMDISTGFSETNDSTIPDFLYTEIEELIERADRAMINCDMSALMSGNIYADMGAAVLRGYESRHVNVLRQMSVLRRVIGRNVQDGRCLVEVETSRQEGPKGADVYATYRDVYYMVIEQRNQKFVITDQLIKTRQLQVEPEINPDSATTKRLVALGLAGEVDDVTKAQVDFLIKSLYAASSGRKLYITEDAINNGSNIVNIDGNQVALKRGMYDLFDSDVTMLSSSKREDLNSRIRALLVKFGTKVYSTVYGAVTEWIGGADNQVEFICEEVYTYQGRSDGVYTNTYYLVSKMGDEWVIDDMKFLTPYPEDHSGEQFNSEVQRLKFDYSAIDFMNGDSSLNYQSVQQQIPVQPTPSFEPYNTVEENTGETEWSETGTGESNGETEWSETETGEGNGEAEWNEASIEGNGEYTGYESSSVGNGETEWNETEWSETGTGESNGETEWSETETGEGNGEEVNPEW